MPPTRITAVRDALAARVNAAWVTQEQAVLTPPSAGQRARQSAADEVITRTVFDVNTAKITGRKIHVLRASLEGDDATRKEDEFDYGYRLFVVEKFTDPGDPTEEWIDERVEFCEWLRNLVGNVRAPRLLAVDGQPNSGLWPVAADIPVVLDHEELVSATRKLFVGVVSVTLREQVAAPPEG